MKKVLFQLVTIVALFTSVAAQAQQKAITETAVNPAEGTVVTHNLYNASGYVILKLAEGVSQTVYQYNALNQVEREEYTDLVNDNLSRNYVYTYNAEGLVDKKEELAGTRLLYTDTYTYDSHGNVTKEVQVNESAATKTATTLNHENTYDANGNLSKESIKLELPIPGMPAREIQTRTLTYNADGRLVREEQTVLGSVTTITITTYEYDTAGLLTTKTVTVNDEVPTITYYAYADIDVENTPTNVAVTVNAGNTVTLTWTGQADGVVYDGKFYEVTGNSYTTGVLTDGTYSFYLSNHGNAVVKADIDVVDNTKVGVSNVALNGEVYVTTEEVENTDGDLVQRRVYHIPVKWTLPEGSSPVSYRIYYNEQYYVDVEDGTLREYEIEARNVTAWSMANGEYNLDFEIRVLAIYATGEVEPANTLPLNTADILALEPTGIAAVVSGKAEPVEVYSLKGVRVGSSLAGLSQGVYVVRQGRDVKKIAVR